MQTPFAVGPESYDVLSDWGRRAANEQPFFRQLLRETPIASVLDAACGTGRHAAMFRSWGLEVEAADRDDRMIAACKRLEGDEDPKLRWCVRPYEDSACAGREFDLTICIGNSLALAGDLSKVESALRAMLQATSAGGVCVVQVLNLWRLPDGPSIWQKLVRARERDQALLLKGVHRSGDWGYVDFVEIELGGDAPSFRSACERFRGIEADALAAMAAPLCEDVSIFGDYQRHPYERESSPDLIAVFRRSRTHE